MLLCSQHPYSFLWHLSISYHLQMYLPSVEMCLVTLQGWDV